MPASPSGTATITVPTLGSISGLVYTNGVKQFCGIPYATLKKRWSRSELTTSLPGGHHNGTDYGPIAPQPPEYRGDDDPMVPVKRLSHFPHVPPEDEFGCLNLNVAMPPDSLPGPHPVMVWIHGGSLLFGSSSHPTYDLVKLVSHSIDRGTPVVCVSLNYRVGLFGFLASRAIQTDLAACGQTGAGNFGLTDQQTGLAWVQRYIAFFGGDTGNVTIFGESAGGMSVSYQVCAARPAVFHRSISMSGNLNTIPVWTVEQHEKRYRALLVRVGIDPDDAKALEKLRAVPQETLVSATCPIDGTVATTGNACNDGWFFSQPPAADKIASPPAWLKSYMVGNVKDEAMIFRHTLEVADFALLRNTMTKHMSPSAVDRVLSLYGIVPDVPKSQFVVRVERMATDCLFHVQDRIHLRRSQVPSYGYHFDQVSTLNNPLEGLAYHAIDLLYVFLNLWEEMTPGQQKLALRVSGDFIDYAYGKEPWEQYGVAKRWRIYGPDDVYDLKTEAQDEAVRQYSRMDQILSFQELGAWIAAVDDFVDQRYLMGTN
ncbi:hypothetical protein SEUCBS139899_010737 [Sporothrix eucalyptigena]|uniref:Carboxylic ester hydrolase n=1 Tax=Sporothrix eucalyptigena TaxID=1812306 RepID=A0ABP0D1J7_9PEZI